MTEFTGHLEDLGFFPDGGKGVAEAEVQIDAMITIANKEDIFFMTQKNFFKLIVDAKYG